MDDEQPCYQSKELDRLKAQKTNDDTALKRFGEVDEPYFRRIIAGYEATIRTQIEVIAMFERILAGALEKKPSDYS